MDRGLKGKVALITGGGSGIGRATALRLASEGAKVFLIGRRADRIEGVVAEVEAAGGRASCLSVDLAAEDCGSRAVEAAVAWGGGLDVLVNAAGTFPYTPVHELSDADWNEAIAINLSGVMRMCRAAAGAMGESGGAIVNISSTNAVMGDKVSCCSAYSAAKAGQLGLTKQFAAELAPAIRVNAILPGPIDTEMLEGWLDDPDERAAWMERYIPMDRLAHADEVASAVAFLASRDGGYITGVVLPVDGGMTLV